MNNFTEEQSLGYQKSIQWIFRISFVVYTIGIIVGWIKENLLLEVFLIVLAGTVVLYFVILKMKMKTIVTKNHLEINHPFVGNYTLPIVEIESIKLISDANIPSNRRTFHKNLGTLYRMYGNEGILVKMNSKNTFFVGSQQAEILEQQLQHKLKMQRTNQAD